MRQTLSSRLAWFSLWGSPRLSRHGFARRTMHRLDVPSRSNHAWVAIALIPATAGGIYWSLQNQASSSPAFYESQHLSLSPTILSPAEPELSIMHRLVLLVKVNVLEPILTVRRLLHLIFIFIPVVITTPLLLIGWRKKKRGGERWGAIKWYAILTRQMERAGPTYVKLAQWAASRTDLFPAALCDRLGALHSHGKPHSFRYTKKIIEKVFQMPFEEVFESFDEQPIGVGAVAQVYRATLKPTLVPRSHLGPKRERGAHLPMPYPLPLSLPTSSVAIKVLHPRADTMIKRDLSIMAFFANIISFLPGMQWISLPEEVKAFGSLMNGQLDLRNEAVNLATFEKNFGKRRAAVTFPRPLQVFSSRDVLIEEFQHALPLEYFLSNGGGPFDAQIAQIGLDAFLNMLLLDNFVHSDLHPGNIMVKFYKPSTGFILKGISATLFNTAPPDDIMHSADVDATVDRLKPLSREPNKWRAELERLAEDGYQPELVFLDCGLVTELDRKNRRNFVDLFAAIAQFDGYRAGKLMVERCRMPELVIDEETFALKIQHLILKVKKETFSLAHIKISNVLTEVLRAVRQHHVKMEADFINTVLSVLLLEGIGRQLDPSLDLFRSSLPILRQLGRQMPLQQFSEHTTNMGAMLKLWVWAEARSFASNVFQNVDDLVRHDLIAPNV